MKRPSHPRVTPRTPLTLTPLTLTPLTLLPLLVLLATSSLVWAQGAGQLPGTLTPNNVQFSLGISNQQVAEAWNPLRLQLRDVAPATLTLQIDQGTLRSGQVPLTATYEVRGGAGVSLFEELLYLPNFANLSWRLATPERVLASGSVSGREADARPLDLLLTSNPGAYRAPYYAAFGFDARLVDVTASTLPLEPAAYSGVRSLIIDGTAAAPSLESVAAAVSGGAIVALAGPLPASHDELLLLLGDEGASVRLGAGALLYVEGGRDRAVEAVSATEVPNRQGLMAAALARPLVTPPAQLKEGTMVLAAALFAAAVLLLVRWAGAPGVTAALALGALVAVVGWQLLRPDAPQLNGATQLALVGGDLSLDLAALEVLTMPRATLTVPHRARPLRAQAYWLDASGTNVPLERWRSVLLELAPELSEAQLTVQGGQPYNRGPGTLHQVYVVGQGLLGQLAPGSGVAVPTEAGTEEWIGPLAAQLPDGAVLARSDCAETCITWVVYPQLALLAERSPTSPVGTPQFEDPFRGAPGRVGEGL